MAKKNLQIAKYKKSSFLKCCCCCLSEKPATAQLQIKKLPKNENESETFQKPHVVIEENEKRLDECNKKRTEKIIKDILTKYLALKQAEQFRTKLPVLSDSCDFQSIKKVNQYDSLHIEYCSENRTLCDNKSSMSRAFLIPCKSKSAPTTSFAHDSFTDIYERICRLKESTISDASKKLELIFKKSSYDRESNSNSSLQYKISCDKKSSQNYSSVR